MRFSAAVCLIFAAAAAGFSQNPEEGSERPPEFTIFVLTEFFELEIGTAAKLLGDPDSRSTPNELRAAVQQLLETGEAKLADFNLVQLRHADAILQTANELTLASDFDTPPSSPADELQPSEILKTVPAPTEFREWFAGDWTKVTAVASRDGESISIYRELQKSEPGPERAIERAAHLEGNPVVAANSNLRAIYLVEITAVENGGYAFLGAHTAVNPDADEKPRQLLIFLRAWTEKLKTIPFENE